ncbi:MAG: PucR family transcriptional regulator [Actinobacteria bacterium]|nr:PucR family transcriptional regulator [Actinomycetota bacterium]
MARPDLDAPPQMARMTVAAALDLPVLRHGLPKLVAGSRSVRRPIRWVHAGEVPNIASMLSGGELLLTTGMGIAATEDQRDFVADLASREIAGLVIELGGTFSRRLPAGLVEAAERQGLPLIELHAPVRFVAVTEAIHTEIVNRDYELLRRAGELHRSFTTSMLGGEGVPGVLDLLAKAIGNPVFLEGRNGRLLGHAGPSPGSGEVLVTAWPETRERVELIGIEATVGADRVEHHGRLVALPVERPFDAFAPLALERAAEMVALALLRSRQEEELLAVGHGNLLTSVADGKIGPEAAAARLAGLGLEKRDLVGFLPIAARLHAAPATDEDLAGASWTGALRDVDRGLESVGAPIVVGTDPAAGNLLILAGLRRSSSRTAVADRVDEALRAAAAKADRTVVVAVAGVCSWDEVGAGLRDATDSALMHAGDAAPGWIDAAAQPLELLLWRLGDQKEVPRFVDRVIGPVIEHDAKSKHTLLPTLEALCAHGGRRAATARALSLNRQALYGRIERLERILAVDLSEAESLTPIHVALLARRPRGGAR